MSSIRFVLDSGVCVANTATRPAHIARQRKQAYQTGQVCSACLVGSWPQTLLRSQQYLCASCQHLGHTIAASSQSPWTLGNQDEIRLAARSLRTDRLSTVFDAATANGCEVSVSPEGIRELSYANYLDLVGGSAAVRAQRFVAWVQTVAPDLASSWAALLSDVKYLTAEIDRHHRRVLRAQARIHVERAQTDLRAAVGGAATAAPLLWRAVVRRHA